MLSCQERAVDGARAFPAVVGAVLATRTETRGIDGVVLLQVEDCQISWFPDIQAAVDGLLHINLLNS